MNLQYVPIGIDCPHLSSGTKGPEATRIRRASSSRTTALYILARMERNRTFIYLPTATSCDASQGYVQTTLLSQRQAHTYG